jgi:hypothetical protein
VVYPADRRTGRQLDARPTPRLVTGSRDVTIHFGPCEDDRKLCLQRCRGEVIHMTKIELELSISC